MPDVVFGGMPAWLLETYLLELGGSRDDDGSIRSDGWRAHVIAALTAPPALGRVTVTIEGPGAASVLEQLRSKAQRGGG